MPLSQYRSAARAMLALRYAKRPKRQLCRRCGSVRPRGEFPLYTRSLDGRFWMCIKCCRAQVEVARGALMKWWATRPYDGNLPPAQCRCDGECTC
mgnify:CR=1 FL=1